MALRSVMTNPNRPVGGVAAVESTAGGFRRPAADILPIGVELFSLTHQIEVASAAGIGANTGNILPVAPVAGHIVVNQLLLEPGRTVAPVDVELVYQTTGGNLTPTVGNKAGGVEFTHTGIDQWPGGRALAPLLETFGIKAGQWCACGYATATACKQTRPVLECIPLEILAPKQFKADPVG